MDYVEGNPAANMIWSHDNELLQKAVMFYQTLKQRLGVFNYSELDRAVAKDTAVGFDAEQWTAIQSAHAGYQMGTEILSVLPYIAGNTGFFDLSVNADLSIHIPSALTDSALQEQMAKMLAPPPVASSDEILSESGGMFYPREAPGMETFVEVGSHFNEGDALYIVEVMKMFNKVYAPFAGTVEQILMEGDGVIIKKGQPLFKITPDEDFVVESPEDVSARRHSATAQFLDTLK